jgi:hypothetical protein
MTIKKGLAVIDSNGVVTHKLMDDGEVVIGKTGAQFDLKGAVYLGANASGRKVSDFSTGGTDNELVYNLYNTSQDAYATYGYTRYNFNAAQAQLNQASEDAIALAYVEDEGNAMSEVDYANMVSANNTYSGYRYGAYPTAAGVVDTNIQALDSAYAAKMNTESDEQHIAWEKMDKAMDAETSAELTAFEAVNAAANNVTNFQDIVDFISGKDTANDSALITAIGGVETNISNEESAASTANTSIQDDLNTEVNTSEPAAVGSTQGATTSVNAAVASHWVDAEAHRTAANSEVEGYIATKDASLQTLIDAETAARIAGDSTLTSNIEDLAAGESGAGGAFSALLSAETSTRTSTYSDLSATHSTMHSTMASTRASLTSRLSLQIDARVADMITLSGEQAAHSTTFSTQQSTAISALSDARFAETQAQTTGSNSVMSLNTQKSTEAANDEQTLSSSIDTEVSLRISVHSSLSTTVSGIESQMDVIVNTPTNLDEFSEIVTYITNEMGESNSTNRLNISTQVSTLESLIADEQSAQDTADGVLRTNLIAEKSSMDSALVSFTTRKNTHVNTTIPSISTAVQVDYTNDNTTFDSDLVTTKASLLQDITDQEAAASTADSLIQDTINAELTNRATAVSGERTAQQNADTALSAQIDAFQASGFSGVNVTVTGDASLGNLSAAASATVKVGTLAAPPAIPANTADQNGMMFYLDMPSFSASGPFTENKKWYFCENGVWHMSPFYQE